MDIAIISSTKDKASINIRDNLIKQFNFIETKSAGQRIFYRSINNFNLKIYTIQSELIYTSDLDMNIDADNFIFISKHQSKEEIASLTCHPIGNFGKAEHGGIDSVLCFSNPILLKKIFIELNINASGTKYGCTMEATHHGPSIGKPVCFVELGSTDRNWTDNEGGYLVAKSLIHGIEKYSSSSSKQESKNYSPVFVIGGSHYNHVGNKAMLKNNLAVGHICPKHNLEKLNIQMVKTAMERCNAKSVLVDWKGLGKEKKRIIELLDNFKISYTRSDKL
jgi:D-aminoacyl-tRNA deacylase